MYSGMSRTVLTVLTAAAFLPRIQAQTNRYVAGDFHQHTTYTDGSYSFGFQASRNNQFGLDWWANSEAGGRFNKFGRISGTGADPLGTNITWTAAGVTPLGNNLAGGDMWRWQSIRDYSFADVLTARAGYPTRMIIQAYEWNVPGLAPSGAHVPLGHEHCSMGCIAGQFDPTPNANTVAQFEYQFDMSDNDTSAANGMSWTKSINDNGSDAKMIEAAAWLQTHYSATSWLVPAHPEGRGAWNAATFRRLNDAAPTVAFGFESMPGHQKAPNRGDYGSTAVGGGTYGGCGTYAAKVGGLWDSLLGEGRRFWLFSSSDSKEVSTNDFYPGEYQKTYTYVTNDADPQALVAGLRSGNSFVVQGDLIDRLDFTVAGAPMGSVVTSRSNVVVVRITVHDPAGTNNGPAGHNLPALSRIDLIAGLYHGAYLPTDPSYNSDSNVTTRVVARFDAVGGLPDGTGLTSIRWTNLGAGWKQMSFTFDTRGFKTYFRLRGSNWGLRVAGQTDAGGNPILDVPGSNNVTNAFDDLWFYSNPVFVDLFNTVLTGPANGTVVTSGLPTLSWAPAAAATGYTVALTSPDGTVLHYDLSDTSLPLWFPLTNGAYSWTVTPFDGTGHGVASATNTFFLYRTVPTGAWKFGIIPDSQWTEPDDGYNPNTVAANIIKQVDSQFIAAGVKLVVAIGDMVDVASQVNDYTRALYVQDLYNAGIGFYPTRGNHEAADFWTLYLGSSADFRHAYPQIVPGPLASLNNHLPPDISAAALIPLPDLTNIPPAAPTGSPFSLGVNFSAPTAANLANDSVSYAFDYNNATFMLLDQFQSPEHYTSHIPEQQPWIDSTLVRRPPHTHAFVFTHKNLLGANHKDNMFGGQLGDDDPGDGYGVDFSSLLPEEQVLMIAKTNAENAFLASMRSNDVRYVISGHDHLFYNSIVISPDQRSRVHQLIVGSASSKFYDPMPPFSANDLPIGQELNRIGYDIVTVDGPRVTIDYYADTTDYNYTGPFNFVKRASAGYSLNGQEFVLPQRAAYSFVADSTVKAVANGEIGYLGTAMHLLGGTNASTARNAGGKLQNRALNTGWAPASAGNSSDTLTLWGLADLGADHADTVVVSMTYHAAGLTDAQITSGLFCLGIPGPTGGWVNAVDANVGGTTRYVNGPWVPDYGLGTYGIDRATDSAWAVVNHGGQFAVTLLGLVISPPGADGFVCVTWPTNLLPGYVLQFNHDLSTTNWVATTNCVPANGTGFFRLVKP
jgi:hypothetical protein